MVSAVTDGALRLQRRIEASCERHGVQYPWWIPAYSSTMFVTFGVIALGQRGFGGPLVVAGFLLVLAPIVVWAARGLLLPSWVEALVIAAGVCLFLTTPADVDFAPLLLTVSAAEIAAISRVWIAGILTAGQVAVLVVISELGTLDFVAVYVVCVLLGLDVGMIVRWQMRAINAERANAAAAEERAAVAERQRLAREIHDIVGHALSVTLLHVTAARHSLQQHADIPDAIESLGEAEQAGRSAMRDLRSTVDVLGETGGATAVLPGVQDIAALVEGSRSAGLDVRFTGPERVTVAESAGLGLYRIAQESLANVAKHAPTAATVVTLTAGDESVRLIVRNTLPGGRGVGDDTRTGTGLPGMAARAEQMGATLRTGIDDAGDWVVDVRLRTRAADQVQPA